jgi:hypothetical protein
VVVVVVLSFCSSAVLHTPEDDPIKGLKHVAL